MDVTRISEWLKNPLEQGWIDPPGCETEFVSLPSGNHGCCNIGIVHEHRFAFYYWGLYATEANNPPSPILLSLDSHNDVGVPDEVVPDDLNNLHISNRIELGLFSWLRLRSLNDGHIRPALYLNFFSDAYILLNKDEKFTPPGSIEQQKDREGHIHTIKFYNDRARLLRDLPPEALVLLDIDLDFFATDNPAAGSLHGSEQLKSDAEITSTLSLKGPFMKPLLDKIVGLTIALEPKYCGGLRNSLHVLEILNREFFDDTLCTNSCTWKKI